MAQRGSRQATQLFRGHYLVPTTHSSLHPPCRAFLVGSSGKAEVRGLVLGDHWRRFEAIHSWLDGSAINGSLRGFKGRLQPLAPHPPDCFWEELVEVRRNGRLLGHQLRRHSCPWRYEAYLFRCPVALTSHPPHSSLASPVAPDTIRLSLAEGEHISDPIKMIPAPSLIFKLSTGPAGKSSFPYTGPAPKAHQLTIAVLPQYSGDRDWLSALLFVAYHRLLGADRFLVYLSSASPELRAALSAQPAVELVDWPEAPVAERAALRNDSLGGWLGLARQDALLRSRGRSEYLAFLGWEDFVWLKGAVREGALLELLRSLQAASPKAPGWDLRAADADLTASQAAVNLSKAAPSDLQSLPLFGELKRKRLWPPRTRSRLVFRPDGVAGISADGRPAFAGGGDKEVAPEAAIVLKLRERHKERREPTMQTVKPFHAFRHRVLAEIAKSLQKLE